MTARTLRLPILLFSSTLLLLSMKGVRAQVPRINTLFPIGGRVGETVEVELRGSSLAGGQSLMVQGAAGVTGTVVPGGNKVDETNKPVWQGKCASCHELRSPANRSMTPGQWAATVDRMVRVRQAPLSAEEATKVTQYLQSAARAGLLTAKLSIAPDALPGLREVRLVTTHGVSTAALFEVGSLPEVMAVPGKLAQPVPITLPCVANGTLAGSSERHYFKFTAQAGQRYVFNLKAYRYKDLNQMFFNPDLRLYDAQGKELVENHSYYQMDPLIDWTCPQAGDYTLEVRDLLGRGNPGNVYRLTMGNVPYDTVLYPPAARMGAGFTAQVAGKNVTASRRSYTTTAPDRPGLTQVSSPWGPQPFYISPYPVVKPQSGGTPVALPATFAGRIASPGTQQMFTLQGGGRWEFEIYAERVGSPATVRVTLLNQKGQSIDSMAGESRMSQTLEAGKTYQLKVEEAGGKGGEEYVYAIEAHPAQPYLQAVARPDNILLRPGAATTVEVILTRRDGVDGDVTVTADGLPAGVTAKPATMAPDSNRVLLILDAATSAPSTVQPFNIRVTGKGGGNQTYTARCIPQEEYRLNNDPRYIDRESNIAFVGSAADFSAGLVPSGPIRVDVKKGVEIKVKLQRHNGYKGGLVARIDDLPRGWTANQEYIPGDRDEVTLLLRPNGDDQQPFIKRDPAWSPVEAVVEIIQDEVNYVAGTFRVEKPIILPEPKKQASR